ncbi:aldose epimerase family protein [Streptomyces cacaoi]|uniref:Aldose 1-epimerase n=1 Tax=Streptomyces cacaoi TaxID=1898 RepID=A0A4Y3QV20_STRCI|nr:aldose epimerase family protein [Streptomyces cacaoi]NNG83767.1 galactose mutarotase [Streptomyces cacaoi]GEB49091.1 aldose 1-epimerase [Streptomyces cacaoi]
MAASIRRERIGTSAGHAGQGPTPVDSYTLDTGAGLAVEVWTYGAQLVRCLVPDREGRTGNVVVRLPDLAAYEDRAANPYVGSTVGRYCRCVAGGRFRLDGVEHRLDRNDGAHHIHGGPAGFDRYVWEAEAEQRADGVLALRLRLESPDGDQGYPGTLSAEVCYEVSPEGTLAFDHRATTTAATLVGLTNHAYWNLAGSGRVDGHRLALNSGRAVVFDDELIPLPGPPADITGGPLDHRRLTPLDDRRLDNCFVLDGPEWAARLHDPASGRTMRVVTDQPAVGVYTADGFAGRRRCGICLEAGPLPDAPNRDDYPPVRLDPGETYRHRTVHHFSAR